MPGRPDRQRPLRAASECTEGSLRDSTGSRWKRTWIPAAHRRSEGPLTRQNNPGAPDKRPPAPSQRSPKPSPWNRFDPTPGMGFQEETHRKRKFGQISHSRFPSGDRALHHLKNDALQVVGFGNAQQHRMISSLHPLVQDPNLPAGIGGGAGQNAQKHLLAQMVRTRTGH